VAFKVVVFLLLALIAWGLWMGREMLSSWQGQEPKEEPVQVEPAPELPLPPPAVPPEIEEIEEPAPVPLTEAQELAILDNRVRVCIRRQRGMSLPVEIALLTTRDQRIYRSVSVVRLEPDGIHVQHGGGLNKLDLALLPDDVKTRFFIEEDLAVRYRTVIAERQMAAEQGRARKQKQADPAVGAVASTGPVDGDSSPRGNGRCDVCGKRVPASQIKVFWSRVPGTTTMGHVQFCRQCSPSSNGVDPYMKR
jgi:hypothetical protein